MFNIGLGYSISPKNCSVPPYYFEIFNLVLLTRENLTISDLMSLEAQDYDLYLEILQEIQKGEERKQEIEKSNSKHKR